MKQKRINRYLALSVIAAFLLSLLTQARGRKMRGEKSGPSYKQALANIKAALKETKLQAELKLINVESAEKARKLGFQGSPSVRINGKDLEGKDEGFNFSCRLYQVDGKLSVAPSKEAIIRKLESLMK